jgi:hypothetical protein
MSNLRIFDVAFYFTEDLDRILLTKCFTRDDIDKFSKCYYDINVVDYSHKLYPNQYSLFSLEVKRGCYISNITCQSQWWQTKTKSIYFVFDCLFKSFP